MLTAFFLLGQLEAEIEFLQSQLDLAGQKSKSDVDSIVAIKTSSEAALRAEIEGLQEQLQRAQGEFVVREEELLDLIRHLQAMSYRMLPCACMR